VLAWHVDYWDKLNYKNMGVWKDPFSLAAATARQSRYAKAYGEKGKWTPQFRVDNKSLRGKGLSRQIQAALTAGSAKPAPAKLSATATWTDATDDAPATVTVAMKLAPYPQTGPAGMHQLLPLLVQKQAVTDVPVGENRGKTLKDFFIVRVLGTPVDAGKAMTQKTTEVTLKVPTGVKRENLHVAVLLEEPATMRTLESVVAEIPAPEK
jgi:hypothetical protein